MFCYLTENILLLSHVQLFWDPTTVARQALPMGFPKQEYRSGLPFPPPGDLLDPEMELESPALKADSSQPKKPKNSIYQTLVIWKALCYLLAKSHIKFKFWISNIKEILSSSFCIAKTKNSNHPPKEESPLKFPFCTFKYL